MSGQERQTPAVSVLVVNWNGERLLENCLSSLSCQTYPAREIIVVDNGSTDSSTRLVRGQFPAVKLVELPENRGFSGGNAAGLGAAGGEFIALLNNDARAEPEWLDRLMRPMIEDPAVGVCASRVIQESSGKIESAGDGITTAGVGFNRGLSAPTSRYGAREEVFGACGAAALYRRRMLEEIGFLDEDFFLYDEDSDLNFRARLSGWRCVYAPDAVVYHQGNATSRRLSDLHVYHHARNLEFVWIKNIPTGLMLRFAHHKAIQEAGSFFYLCLRHGKWAPFIRAKRDAVKMLPIMLKKRREIQKGRRISNRYLKSLLTPVLSREMLRRKARQLIEG